MGLVGLELWNLWVAAGVVAEFQVGAFRCDLSPSRQAPFGAWV